jgi:hypothetical protein
MIELVYYENEIRILLILAFFSLSKIVISFFIEKILKMTHLF